MNKYFKILGKTVLLAALVVMGSCKDAWNDHYSFKETESKYPVAKLAETLGDINGFDKFYAALSTTRICDKKGNPTNSTFLDLLLEEQFITVWAPSNSSISDSDWALYTKKGKTNAENYEVAEKFLRNHIARFKHSVGAGTEKVQMLNGKSYVTNGDAIEGAVYHSDDKNIRCSNGVLHCIDGSLPYLPSIYDYIVTSPEYKGILGNWFESFTVEELDRESSVAQGVNENGEMVYIDSVINEYNTLLRQYGYINVEDSTYAVLLPTPELWQTEFDKIKQSFVYNEENLNNDSLQEVYTRLFMIDDMFYNMNIQRYLPDSVFSTQYSQYENRRDGKPYHIFGQPYDKTNGLFGSCIDSVKCSNGMIYITDKWPFKDELTYLRPMRVEGESFSLSRFVLQQATVSVIGNDTLETPVQVMRISMADMYKWSAKLYIHDNLKGKYSIKMVVAPNKASKNPKDPTKHLPNYIHPRISFDVDSYENFDVTLIDSQETYRYQDKKGKWRTGKGPLYLVNNPSKIDTLDLGTVELPFCNYDMNEPRLAITLESGVDDPNEYSTELWLDCFLLEPIVE